MPISDVDRQLVLIQSVGDIDFTTGDPVLPTAQGSTGIVMTNIGRIWLKYADKAVFSPYLRDLYVQREAHDLVIARLESIAVDFSTNNGQINVRLSQRLVSRRAQREAVEKDLLHLESQIAKNSPPLTIAIAATSPIAPPLPGAQPTSSPFGPDGNDPTYQGSPYWRPRRHIT